MNPHPIRTIFDLADYFGLRIEFRDDLPANNAGFLQSADEPQYIAVNRSQPYCEEVFTIAHELCHYFSDHKRPHRKFRSRLLNGKYKSRGLKIYVASVRRWTNKILPRELEADMFAMSWLVQHEGGTVLKEFIDRHPEKTWLCVLVTADSLMRLPFRIVKSLLRKLIMAQAKP
jgi:hypothetical protein